MLTSSGMTGTSTFNSYCSLTASSHMTPVVILLLYGRDACCPTETSLSQPLSPYKVDIDDYCSEVTLGLTEAWKTAQTNVALAQKRQKVQHDKKMSHPIENRRPGHGLHAQRDHREVGSPIPWALSSH